MDTKFNFGPHLGERLVYVRSVDVADLPEDIRAEAQGAEELYAVCTEDGEQLALVSSRNLAFILARQNDFAPVSVH
ncbi:DUF1150 family protein [Aliiroseovarius sp. YM-037]|uniref:DUF1150 family protein n=1 Tax=Aliiroseovarius sp. YM-037 TaxID=3341728 RepID=UPI003A7F65E4